MDQSTKRCCEGCQMDLAAVSQQAGRGKGNRVLDLKGACLPAAANSWARCSFKQRQPQAHQLHAPCL